MKLGNYKFLIGIDEVGRGPLAGPVAVGAFLIPVGDLVRVRRIFRGIKESKQLSAEKREEWFRIIQCAQKEGLIDFRVSFMSEKVIDGKGLSFAIRSALRSSLGGLRFDDRRISPTICRVLLDGGLKAPLEYIDQKTIVKGDEKEMVIALASICAKVLMDGKLTKLSPKYPEYGLHVHKGYGTKAHYAAIRKYGMCPIHRRSFLKRMD